MAVMLRTNNAINSDVQKRRFTPVMANVSHEALGLRYVFFALNQAQSLEADLSAIKASAVKAYVQEAVAKTKPNALLSLEAVPSVAVAVQIHTAVAGAIYGKEHIEQQRPHVVTRSGRFWVVFGTLTPR